MATITLTSPNGSGHTGEDCELRQIRVRRMLARDRLTATSAEAGLVARQRSVTQMTHSTKRSLTETKAACDPAASES